MKRFLIAMLALSSFPFDISSLPVKNDLQPVEITAPQIPIKAGLLRKNPMNYW
jgi:hypothetical protein